MHCDAAQCAAPASFGGQHGMGTPWQWLEGVTMATAEVAIAIHTPATARARNARGCRQPFISASLRFAAAARK
jgi:hypothetical protein